MNNKAIDIPIYGGYDRKINGESGTGKVHYYRLPLPVPFSDGALTQILGIYGSYISGVAKDETNKQVFIQLNSTFFIFGGIPPQMKELLVKAPDVYIHMAGRTSEEEELVDIQANSLQEFAEAYASLPGQEEFQKIAKFLLDNEITEEEYNAAIEELEHEADSI